MGRSRERKSSRIALGRILVTILPISFSLRRAREKVNSHFCFSPNCTKMALVDYGSDSETEAAPPPPIVPPPKPSTKRAKGPVRILLDLPKPSTATAAPAEPAPKRAKFVPGSTGGGGLAAMLPKPKNESVELRLERSLGAASGSAFVPHTIAKGVKKAETAAAVDFFGLSA